MLILSVITTTTAVFGMKRVVTQERLYTPLNEVYLLKGTKVSYEEIYAKEGYSRAELRQALATYLHDKLRISGYFHYEKKSDYE